MRGKKTAQAPGPLFIALRSITFLKLKTYQPEKSQGRKETKQKVLIGLPLEKGDRLLAVNLFVSCFS